MDIYQYKLENTNIRKLVHVCIGIELQTVYRYNKLNNLRGNSNANIIRYRTHELKWKQTWDLDENNRNRN